MDWVYLLTSIEGRISRKPFWIVLLALSVLELAPHYAWGERWGSLVSLMLAYPEFALFAKRGHDRNVPTWVAGVFMVAASMLSLLSLLDLAGSPDTPSLPLLVLGLPVGIMGLILLVDFGFRRGTAGPNRFGPDPLHGTAE